MAFDALLDYTWILQPAGSPAREVVEREFNARHQPMPRGLVETGSILTTMNLVDRSTMLGVIPLTVAQRRRARSSSASSTRGTMPRGLVESRS